jgi:IS30 family transposase
MFVRRAAKARPRLEPVLWAWVRRLLAEHWSPEQVSLWLVQERGLAVSHEWIYQYVLREKCRGGTLYRHLRSQRRRCKRYATPPLRGRIAGQVSIECRPAARGP